MGFYEVIHATFCGCMIKLFSVWGSSFLHNIVIWCYTILLSTTLTKRHTYTHATCFPPRMQFSGSQIYKKMETI